MYHHVKQLMYTARVDHPDPRFGNMVLEQFGGANGELAAAMQYTIQAMNADDPARKDLLMDIGTEELSHLEIVGALARMHLRPMRKAAQMAEADPLVAITGAGPTLCNCMGHPWTADYLQSTGDLTVDLWSDVAAEARAKMIYERLMNFCDDPGTKDALRFLMSREASHMKAFLAALESLGRDPSNIGKLRPQAEFVDLYCDASTGQGGFGDVQARGPWNEADGVRSIEAPAQVAAESAVRAMTSAIQASIRWGARSG